jgi:hypothetical protein
MVILKVTISLPPGARDTLLVSSYTPSIPKTTSWLPSVPPVFVTVTEILTVSLGKASAGSIIRPDTEKEAGEGGGGGGGV